MKIFHSSDLHFCAKHLSLAKNAFLFAILKAIEDDCECAVISGDSFDSAINIHEPAVHALMELISILAGAMPVLILQGTFSHDRPGCLKVLGHINSLHPIYIADKAEQVYLTQNEDGYKWVEKPNYSGGYEAKALFSCLPSINKAEPEIMSIGAKKYVEGLLADWAFENATAIVPTILVTHGTVNGCVTESKYAMISPDHEFTPEILFSAKCDAVMVGHIHKHQYWKEENQIIAYPGSISRYVFGHNDPVGFLEWDIDSLGSKFIFIETPAPRLIDVSFTGAPNMDDLKDVASNADDEDRVRITYHVDQEFAYSVDKGAIRELFKHVSVLKIEGVINPVESVRAKGIATAETTAQKMKYWAKTTGDEDRGPMLEDLLEQLNSTDSDEIKKLISEAAK